MNSVYEKCMACFAYVKPRLPFTPRIAVVLGSGWGDFADRMDVVSTIPYKDIPGFPVSTVDGHKGQFVFGQISGIPVVCMQGRVHYYEGYAMSDVVLPTRLMSLMGAKILFLTNAAGGLQTRFRPGDFMMITDQIGLFVPSPLLGENIDAFGLRFPDMSHIYDLRLQKILQMAARQEDIFLDKGVYCQLTGPQFESPAEIRLCRMMGADAVGMSTACEAIAARHIGMNVCGISFISNMAAGMTDQPLSHEEVNSNAQKGAAGFIKLINRAVTIMGEEVPC